ncbi:TlpA family protein disulfide reductase [Candidatus Poriferisodalis sp.]|uniref:TlpA family protein disulfide reductase n=1 Tax=Candidatus Poriferisodalis sp. TaxID=3101277 RepID=UPI003B022F7B
MERLAIAAVLIVVAIAIATLAQRRCSASATAVPRSELPPAVDLVAVGIPEGPALVVFTEETCRTCQAALAVVRGPAGAGLPVAEVPFGVERELHRQHGIDTVPTTVVADADGRVVDGWVGSVDLSGLAAALAQVVRPAEPQD